MGVMTVLRFSFCIWSFMGFRGCFLARWFIVRIGHGEGTQSNLRYQ